MPDQPATNDVKKKRAYSAFPRLPLNKVLELPKKIYELGEGEPVRRLLIFDKLGKSPSSGSARELIGAANTGYGLISGNYASEYLGLSDIGKQIVASQNRLVQTQAIYEVLFDNEIFTFLLSRFANKGVPLDEIVVGILQTNNSLSKEDATTCWGVVKENLFTFGLVQELSGKKTILSREAALEYLSNQTAPLAPVISDEASKQASSPLPESTVAPMLSATKDAVVRNNIEPQFTFNIQIVLPENASSDTYNAIFKGIATYLLRRGEA